MSSKDNYLPPEQLLDKIEEIATIKQTLSLRDRSLTSGNGLYVQSGRLPDGAIQYMAGGKFIAKLIFVRNLDGSKDIKKYQPGDWETKVNIILQLCRELEWMYESVSNWTPEKTAAYEAEEAVNAELVNRVFVAQQQHQEEIDRQWQLRGVPRWMELGKIFLEELKREWPIEYHESNIIEFLRGTRRAKEVQDLLQRNAAWAYVYGYMSSRGWISQEELANVGLYLGDSVAEAIRDSLKGHAQSKGIAFASAYSIISAEGIINARAAEKETQPLSICEDSKPSFSKAEVLEEMCRLEDMFRISFKSREKGLTYAEANIIMRKVNPLFDGLINPRAFPVVEEANEEDINKWLTNPVINCPLPDVFMMNIAARTPLPAEVMERMLRTLLQENYDTYWKLAEERVRSRR